VAASKVLKYFLVNGAVVFESVYITSKLEPDFVILLIAYETDTDIAILNSYTSFYFYYVELKSYGKIFEILC
jgi:hypothetical protein